MVKKKAKVDVKVEPKNDKNLLLTLIGVVIIVVLFVFIVNKLTTEKIEKGDTVVVDYAGYLADGKVFDTTIESIGANAGLDKESYEPLKFVLNGQEVIPGFEEEVLGMNVGDKKKFTLSADRAYGGHSEQLIREFLRDLSIAKYSDLALDVYKDYFGKDPVVGEEFNAPTVPWKLVILSANEENITVDSLIDVGDRFTLDGTTWETVVVGVTNDTITLRQYPNVGDYIPTPQNPKFAVVTSVTNTTFSADANHPLAGKVLTYEVEVKDIMKVED